LKKKSTRGSNKVTPNIKGWGLKEGTYESQPVTANSERPTSTAQMNTSGARGGRETLAALTKRDS